MLYVMLLELFVMMLLIVYVILFVGFGLSLWW